MAKTKKDFIEAVYEIAFGDDAINRDFSQREVLDRLRTFAYNDLKWTEYIEEAQKICGGDL